MAASFAQLSPKPIPEPYQTKLYLTKPYQTMTDGRRLMEEEVILLDSLFQEVILLDSLFQYNLLEK